MYRYESWTIKKAERPRIGAFELCWRRLLRDPGTARRSNQSILKEINPESSLERLMLKLKLQFFGHLMWRAKSLEKDPDAEKDWRQKEKRKAEDEMAAWHHWLNGHEFEETQTSTTWKIVKDREAWCVAVHGSQKVRQLSNWTTATTRSSTGTLVTLNSLFNVHEAQLLHF